MRIESDKFGGGARGSAAGAVYPTLSAVAETYIALARKVYRFRMRGIYLSGDRYLPFVWALPRYNEGVP